MEKERVKGVLDVSADRPSSITAHDPGYIDREKEVVVGLQTEAPLKRAIMPNGGLRMVEAGLEAYGFKLDPSIAEIYTHYRKSHNDAVFDVYAPDIMACRKSGIITGLPDAYGRGRIIGDYRRVPLYGVDYLIQKKEEEKAESDDAEFTEEVLREREELSEQIRALKELVEMALRYGFDISRPAENAREAVQWLYFAYLAAVKEQNGAAMSIGRISTFLDIYMEKVKKHRTYRNSLPTQSVLTITSNVVYGKKTGNTPDGRRAGEPFAPGANPMHGRDKSGFLAAGSSVAKLPYEAALDGISWTASLVPDAFGKTMAERVRNLSNCLDGFCCQSGFHMNVNVLSRETLLDAMEHPEKYPQLTVRVSGYAVNFVKLNREQQWDVVNRTFHVKA